MRRIALTLIAAGTLVVGACGVQADSEPRDIPDDESSPLIADASTGSDAAGADRIYLVGPGDERLLRAVSRAAGSRENLIEILLLGPNEQEITDQYLTAIPTDTRLLSTRQQGNVFFIDVSEELIELTGAGLTRAVAQIVYTASELDGVQAVQLTVNGERLSWTKSNGDSTTDPLRVYDYPDLVQSAQPAYPAQPATA